MARISITEHLSIDESEIEESFVLSSGPGGQNVNKVASAVQLRFDAARSPGLSWDMRARLATLAGQRMTKGGVIVIFARNRRSQEQNRADARQRLVELLREAATPPKLRRKTRPTFASKKKRIEKKVGRGSLKKLRAKPAWD